VDFQLGELTLAKGASLMYGAVGPKLRMLKPHCIQSSQQSPNERLSFICSVYFRFKIKLIPLIPCIVVTTQIGNPWRCLESVQPSADAVTRVMVYVTNAVTWSSTMRTGGFELASSALTSSTLKWLQRSPAGAMTVNTPFRLVIYRAASGTCEDGTACSVKNYR
jgi:hypothetical protein